MSADLDALPPIPRDEDGPVFRAPWEAQAFAMAVLLNERGHFTWKEWAGRLADEIATAKARGEHDDGQRYYHFWLAAQENKTCNSLAKVSTYSIQPGSAYTPGWSGPYGTDPGYTSTESTLLAYQNLTTC